MPSPVTIPSALASLPCILTDAAKNPLIEGNFVILKVCQRESTPTTVDIWYEIPKSGTWILDLSSSGYKASDQKWYMLKPDFADSKHDGTQKQVTDGGDFVSFIVTTDKRSQYRFVWDPGAEYSGFLSDPDIPIHMTFKKYEDTIWYPFRNQSIVGTNDAGNQTEIQDPTQ